jgi:putative SOS response-associated peptidase YedK
MSGDIDFYADYYGVDDVVTGTVSPSWNVAPTDETYVVAEQEDRRRLGTMRWGLVPHWADDLKSIHINARAETVATKDVFRSSLARRRCLVPCDGFYEWEPAERGRTPHWVFRADGHPMTFAAIWSTWRHPVSGDEHPRFSIITTEAQGVVRSVHDRMPVALPPELWDPWLDRSLDDAEAAAALIQPIDPDLVMEHTVSSRVNNVRNNDADLNQHVAETLF